MNCSLVKEGNVDFLSEGNPKCSLTEAGGSDTIFLGIDECFCANKVGLKVRAR